jgi:hypothetical protein
MADVPNLEKKRELLAPKTPKGVGPLGKIVLLGGAALVGLGMTPSASAFPTATPSVQAAPPPTSTSSAAPLVLQGAETTNAALAGHGSHSSHASHASHASHHSSSFA